MTSFDNKINPQDKDQLQSNIDAAQPKVYFRGVNRIHINRFKAYTHIISNRLNADWVITEDIRSANVVVDMDQTQSEKIKSLRMSVLTDTANLKPPILTAFKLIFDDKKLVQQLNLSSKQLKQIYNSKKPSTGSEKVIKVYGLLNQSLSVICDLLNQKCQQKNRITRFIPSVGLISSKSELYRDQLLLIVDGGNEESILAYQTFIKKKLSAAVIIDELTVAIIKSKDEAINEKIFDLVYGNSDDHTQVTMLNMGDENELDYFVSYF